MKDDFEMKWFSINDVLPGIGKVCVLRFYDDKWCRNTFGYLSEEMEWKISEGYPTPEGKVIYWLILEDPPFF